MRDHRQGNDLKVIWSILNNGKPFSLSGKELKLYLKNMYERKEVEDFTARGNQIQWTFYGKDQKQTGKYSLILVGNEGEVGMITIDTCDFVNIVSCSCKVKNSEDLPNVEIETLELTSDIDYVAGTGGGGEGGGSYDDTAIWEALEDKVDKVDGKGLSTNDFTDKEREKLAGLENYDDRGIKKDIEVLSKKVEDLEQGGGSADQSDYPTRDEVAETYLPREEFSETIERYATTDSLEDYVTREEFSETIERYATTESLEDYLTKTEAEEAYQPKGDYATTEELAELSTQVGGLSERVDKLEQGGQGGGSSMFEAVYGETPFADMWAAYLANKHIICRSGNFMLSVVRATDTLISFSAINNENVYGATCTSANVWASSSVFQVEKAQNKVSSITSASKDTQYPTAKAVYDALQNVGGGEPSQYIKEATTSADGNTLTLIKKDNTQVVFSPSGGGGESSGSNEWKCVFEGRPAVGTKNWEFRTFSDGTSLKATEVIIQVLCDKTSTANATGYVQINSTLNKTLTAYGTIGLEQTAAKEAEPLLQEMRLKASPCFMTAEISTSIKATAGQTVNVQRNGGHLKTFEIYEDIVYVRVYTTGVVSENVGLLKIYAR